MGHNTFKSMGRVLCVVRRQVSMLTKNRRKCHQLLQIISSFWVHFMPCLLMLIIVHKMCQYVSGNS